MFYINNAFLPVINQSLLITCKYYMVLTITQFTSNTAVLLIEVNP